MSKTITFVFPGADSALRLNKIASFLAQNGFVLNFIGWPRTKEVASRKNRLFSSSEAIIVGGGEANAKLPFLYILFVCKLFLKLLFKKDIKNTTFFCINFETGFVVWAVSRFRKIEYVYDIWDELALSHNFPNIIVRSLNYFDRKIRRDAKAYIHVDNNRYSKIDEGLNNSVVIYNSPVDYFHSREPYPHFEKSFAVTGWLNKTRGLHSIYEFAKQNPTFKFIIAGKFLQKDIEDCFLSLENVEYHDFIPQDQLFNLICNCRGIFSLYDDKIPINRLAASNKLYDAMMLGVPVIINRGLLVEDLVRKGGFGFVVSYNYDKSWDQLINADPALLKQMGLSGRRIYSENFEFSAMCKKLLMPIFTPPHVICSSSAYYEFGFGCAHFYERRCA